MKNHINNNILIIAGMHRSGTSLVSQWLSRCGLHMGEVLLAASIGNVEGHFEDVDFYRFHMDVLASQGLSSCGWVTTAVSPFTDYQKEKLNSIFAFKNQLNSQWAWKDPRTCLFLTHYRELIPDAYYLHIIRDYQSTVSSMILRDFKNMEAKYKSRRWLSRFIWEKFRRAARLESFYNELSEFYLRVWLNYNEEILANVQCIDEDKYLMVDYAILLDHDKDIFARLNSHWHFDLDYYDFKKVFRQDLLNKPVDIDRYVGDEKLLMRAKELYKQLKDLETVNNVSAVASKYKRYV
jgi:hypothetical protein